MRRRRRLPPDTRPKWDDPDLSTYFGSADWLHQTAKSRLEIYDRAPFNVRERWKYSKDNTGNPCAASDGMPH